MALSRQSFITKVSRVLVERVGTGACQPDSHPPASSAGSIRTGLRVRAVPGGRARSAERKDRGC